MLEKKRFLESFRRHPLVRARFVKEVLQLYQETGLESGLHGVEQLEQMANCPQFTTDQISAFDHDGARFFHKKGSGLKLNVFLLENHYYYVTSICALLKVRHFCEACGRGFERRLFS